MKRVLLLLLLLGGVVTASQAQRWGGDDDDYRRGHRGRGYYDGHYKHHKHWKKARYYGHRAPRYYYRDCGPRVVYGPPAYVAYPVAPPPPPVVYPVYPHRPGVVVNAGITIVR